MTADRLTGWRDPAVRERLQEKSPRPRRLRKIGSSLADREAAIEALARVPRPVQRLVRATHEGPPSVSDFWDEYVGELPDNENEALEAFQHWEQLHGRIALLRAIEKSAGIDAYETSDEVFDAVKAQLRAWTKRGWCP